ncbi:MAG: 30S ribosomal protein S15 [Elusimicrobiota bacterium]
MSISKIKKKELIQEFQRDENDTGSPEVQIAILTQRINNLTQHMKEHSKDYHSRYGLLKLVSKRRKLLDYLKKDDKNKYNQVIKKLRIRK